LTWHTGEWHGVLATAEGKAARCAGGLAAVANGEVTIRVCIAPARSDVGWVEDIGVDELDVGAHLGVEVFVALVNVLAPELCALEQLCAIWHLAAEFVGVFLLDEL
jgi:hypothetical protein